MASDEQQGLVFPADAEGRRSTSSVGRAVVADALRSSDPTGARAAEQATHWRSDYLVHFRRLVEAGLASPDAAVTVAEDGLRSLHERMRVLDQGGEHALGEWPDTGRRLDGHEIKGKGDPVDELVLPYRGDRLRGNEIRRRVNSWVEAGVVEPTIADVVEEVLANPDWLRLEGHTVAVLGAGAEMGPLPSLMRWGARVAAVDLDRAPIWERVLGLARDGAGTLVVPVAADADISSLEEVAGVDLLAEVPSVQRWLEEQPGTLVIGNYVYADGATNARVSVAVDELTTRLQASRDDVALGFLATPTDVFAVPAEAVEHSTRGYDGRSAGAKTIGRPLRALSGGKLLRRNYVAGSDPGINDSLVPQQGPNYALAKRLQRWRATVARHAGRDRLDERRATDAHQVGREEPRARRGVRRSPSLRCRGVRAGHLERADGGVARARPAHRRRPAARAPLAGRGVRGRTRRPLARAVRTPQRARPRRPPGVRRRPELNARP